MKYKYITIEREYGSGGMSIARKAAANCGIPCYGKEILEMVAVEYNIAPEDIEHYEESVTNSLLYTLYAIGKVQSGEMSVLSNEGKVFLAEQKVIAQLAMKGPAVFVGHCAAEAIKDKGGILRVFVGADMKSKTDRIVSEYHIPEAQVTSVMKRNDKRRANYYFANTSKRWTERDGYDLAVNSSKLGIEGCAAAISGVYMAGRQTAET